MGLGIECECGETVVFAPSETEATHLERACKECGRIYRLKVTQVYEPEEQR
jgi:hypothetical protein